MTAGIAIGVDAGASSTKAVLVDREGRVLARSGSGGANARAVGIDTARRNLSKALALLMGPTVRCVCIGASGVARDRDWAEYVEMAEKIVGADVQLLVRHDAQIALRAATDARPAMVVVAGSGSIVYGQRLDGSGTRAGGYGALIGDDGSRYALGLAAIKHCARALDGVDPRGFLANAVCDALRVTTPGELIELVHRWPLEITAVAGLAGIVGECFGQGDAFAHGIVTVQGSLLGDQVTHVARAIRSDAPLPVALTGGAFRAVPPLREFVTQAALRTGACDVFEPARSGAEGAAAIALDRLAEKAHT